MGNTTDEMGELDTMPPTGVVEAKGTHEGEGADGGDLEAQLRDRREPTSEQKPRDPREETTREFIRRVGFNKGSISTYTTFTIMILGIVFTTTVGGVIARFLLSFGLFGFAGGATNWLAVKMLFDKIPLLYGSGVVPRRFRQIRQIVKDTIMRTFFDRQYLERYMQQKAGTLAASLNLEERIQQMLESPAVDELIDQKLTDLGQRPEGMWLSLMGINTQALKPMIKPFVLGMATDVAPLLSQIIDPMKIVNVDRVRNELDLVMTRKLQELTPERVKKLMEDVIRQHLHWLIIWGNVFGGLIGVVSAAVGYGG